MLARDSFDIFGVARDRFMLTTHYFFLSFFPLFLVVGVEHGIEPLPNFQYRDRRQDVVPEMEGK